MTALLLALALLATDGDGLRFEGSVAAGGGYDSSLLAAKCLDWDSARAVRAQLEKQAKAWEIAMKMLTKKKA